MRPHRNSKSRRQRPCDTLNVSYAADCVPEHTRFQAQAMTRFKFRFCVAESATRPRLLTGVARAAAGTERPELDVLPRCRCGTQAAQPDPQRTAST